MCVFLLRLFEVDYVTSSSSCGCFLNELSSARSLLFLMLGLARNSDIYHMAFSLPLQQVVLLQQNLVTSAIGRVLIGEFDGESYITCKDLKEGMCPLEAVVDLQ